MNNDSRPLIYISIMFLIFSCVGLGYGLFFFGWGVGKGSNGSVISPSAIIVVGLILSSANGIAMNIISDQIRKKIDALPQILKVGAPLATFFITLVLSIIIALMNI